MRVDDSIRYVIENVYNNGLDFDVIHTIIEVTGIAINKTPVHIGKGRGELGEVDNPVMKDNKRRPYIPGSSFKGALRSLAEQLARSSGHYVCDIFSEAKVCAFRAELLSKLSEASIKGLQDTLDKLIGELNSIARRYKCPSNYVKEIEALLRNAKDNPKHLEKLLEERPCVVCRVFGNQALASHIITYDLNIIGDPRNIVGTRTRVAIDRFRNASRSGALFDYEYIVPECKWNFKMTLFNIDIVDGTRDVDLLMKNVLKYISTHGLMLGGMKSVGHGLLILDSEKTRVKKYIIKDFDIKLEKEIILSQLVGGKS